MDGSLGEYVVKCPVGEAAEWQFLLVDRYEKMSGRPDS